MKKVERREMERKEKNGVERWKKLDVRRKGRGRETGGKNLNKKSRKKRRKWKGTEEGRRVGEMEDEGTQEEGRGKEDEEKGGEGD